MLRLSMAALAASSPSRCARRRASASSARLTRAATLPGRRGGSGVASGSSTSAACFSTTVVPACGSGLGSSAATFWAGALTGAGAASAAFMTGFWGAAGDSSAVGAETSGSKLERMPIEMVSATSWALAVCNCAASASAASLRQIVGRRLQRAIDAGDKSERQAADDRNGRRHDVTGQTIQYKRAHLNSDLLPHKFPLPRRVPQEPFDLPNIRSIPESSGSRRCRRAECARAHRSGPSRLGLDVNGAIWGLDVAALGRPSAQEIKRFHRAEISSSN